MSTHVPSHTTAIRALVARGGREEAQPGSTLRLGSSVRLNVGQGVVALFSSLTPSLRAQAFCRAPSKAVPASPCRFWTISQPNHRSLIYRHQPPGCVSTAIVACRTTGGGASAQLSRLGPGISLLVQKSSGAARCLMTFAHRTRRWSLELSTPSHGRRENRIPVRFTAAAAFGGCAVVSVGARIWPESSRRYIAHLYVQAMVDINLPPSPPLPAVPEMWGATLLPHSRCERASQRARRPQYERVAEQVPQARDRPRSSPRLCAAASETRARPVADRASPLSRVYEISS
jgi:hypothetical protein